MTKRLRRPLRHHSLAPFGKGTCRGLHVTEAHNMMTAKYMQGREWPPGRGRPDLQSLNEGDDLIHDHEMADISDVSMEICVSLRE